MELKIMQKAQKGFTLIELVVVIVLLGILGVTALGKFEDLSTDARAAAITGIASELSSASAINYADGLLDSTFGATLTAANVCTTALLQNLFQSATWPTGTPAYALNGTGDCATGVLGTAVSCTVYQDTNTAVAGFDALDNQATASVICTG